MIALDTTTLIELEKGNQAVLKKIEELRTQHTPIALPFPVLSEYYYGCLERNKKEQEETINWLKNFVVLHSTTDAALIFSHLKYNLDRQGKTIPLFDILIATLVITHNATLLTTDKHFTRIPELKIELVKGHKIDS